MKKQAPLISCICITHNRPLLLQRAIACFERQTYVNKELVISYPNNDMVTRNLIDQIAVLLDIKIIRVERPTEENLGKARNNAIIAANGRFICTWDDDDWYHDQRLQCQYDAIKHLTVFKASVLMNVILYDYENKQAYYSGYQQWENTLLCEKKTILKNLYLEKEKGEDTAVVHFLLAHNMLYHITEIPHMYIYIYHGDNTWDKSHFNKYFSQAQLFIDEKINKQIRELTSLEYYTL